MAQRANPTGDRALIGNSSVLVNNVNKSLIYNQPRRYPRGTNPSVPISIFQFFFFSSSSYINSNNLIIFNFRFHLLFSNLIAKQNFHQPMLFNSIEKSCSGYLACFHNGRQIIRSVLIYRLMIYLPPFLLPFLPRFFFSSFLSFFLVFLSFFSIWIPFSLL